MGKLKSLKGPTVGELAEREKNARVRMQGDQLTEFFKLRAQLVVALSSNSNAGTSIEISASAHRIARQEFMSAFECTVSAMRLIGQDVPDSDFYKWLKEYADRG